MRIIIGLLIIAAGALITIFNEKVFAIVGRVDWAEDKLGPGGSHFFFQIVGVIIAFIGMTVTFNFFGPIVMTVLGPLFPNKL